MRPAPEPARLAALLGLEPLPEEGGLYRQTHADGHSTAILLLLADGDFSALHVLDGPEVYHWHAGSPLRLLLLEPGGGVSEPVLGPDVAAGQLPQLVVPAGVWQGSSPVGAPGAWTLLGTTMAPPFHWDGFRLGRREDLLHLFPAARGRIEELTRA
jgi:predicted cupin superfamily sugar epimerase